MTYKSLLVHVEPTETGRERVRVAAELARAFEARLVGVGARSCEAMPDPIGLSATHLREAVEADLARAERIFGRETGGLTTLWRASMDSPADAVLHNACSADLIVAGHGVEPHPAEKHAGAADLIMGAGAPVLVAPPGAKTDFRKIVIGWKNTREARRAVWDALPFLQRAESTLIVRFAHDAGDVTPQMSDLVDRLQLHGVRAEAHVRARKGGSVAEELLAAADAIGAELIVVGGYGHSRFREWALGGVTQDLLQKCPKCVFFSH